ncbi:MAG: energy transducer TonB [Flavobacteriaceae bacterium]
MQPFKKNPNKQLEKFSTIFMQIGLVLVLFIVYLFIELETEEKSVMYQPPVVSFEPDYVFSDIQPVVKEKKIQRKKEIKVQKKAPPKILDKVVKGDNTIIEPTLPNIKDEDTKITKALTNLTIIEPIDNSEPDTNVPFLVLEDVPVFPGCKGSKAELKSCFHKKIQKHFSRKFDSDLPNEVGLSSGKKNVILLFVIDKSGNIVDVKAKAPHPRLQKEAIRIVNLLPTMKPGMQRGSPVNVKYTLPMKIIVE